MVTTYVDSSALVAVYVTQTFSKAARQAVWSVPQIPFTVLHELEVQNAFEALVGRRLITKSDCRAIQAQMQQDIEQQRVIPVSLDLERLFADAGHLSRAYTAKHLTRSLNLLHVAAARVAMCSTFVSTDDRQLAVARASGLKVVDIKRGMAK